MSCNVQDLLNQSADLNGLTEEQLLIVQTVLLCQIDAELGGGGITDALLKANNLSDVANVSTSRTNLGLGTGNSPTFTGATLSGLTPGSVLFAGTGGAISQDNTNLFWDNTAKQLAVGSRATSFIGGGFNYLAYFSFLDSADDALPYTSLQIQSKFTHTHTATCTGSEMYAYFDGTGKTLANLEGVECVSWLNAGTITYELQGGNFSVAQIAGNVGSAMKGGAFGIITLGGTAPLIAAGYFINLLFGGTYTTEYGIYVETGSGGTVSGTRYGAFVKLGHAAAKGLVIQGAASAAGNLLEIIDSSSAVLSKVTSVGNGTFQNLVLGLAATTYAATTDISFDGKGIQTLTLTGDVTFTTSNRGAGKSVTIIITCDGTNRNYTFPAGWTFVGTKPTAITASKKGALTLTCTDGNDSGVIAAYAEQT